MRSHKLGYILFFALIWLFCSCAGSQYGRSKQSRLNYSYRYKGRLLTSKQQCDRALRKKYKGKNRKVFAWSKSSKPSKSSSSTSMAEVDPNDTPPPSKPKPKPEPTAKSKSEDAQERFEDMTIEEKHDTEDQVLRDNNIPPPSSQEHERIRAKVEERIANDDFPQELDPLYFIHDDDEFSVVDMEPFLVAVEYALQGRMILIEGHTDASGADDYNVQLSIKRVEKIRKLMHDMGVPDDRISVIGYGEEKADTEETISERSRRVDFKVF